MLPVPAEPSALAEPALLDLSRAPAAVYLGSLAASSRRTMQQSLDVIAGLLGAPDALRCPWHLLTYAHSAAIRAQLAERYAPATGNKMLAALRGVIKECRRLDLMSADQAAGAGDIPPIRGASPPTGRQLARDELQALMAACAADASATGRRDAALLAVAYAGGLRRAELVALDLIDYDPLDQGLLVRRGKGRKARRVYVPAAAGLLRAWLVARGDVAGPLFSAISKSKRVLHRRLSSQAVMTILQARAAQSGVAHCTPHDMRRTLISDLLDAGEDIATVRDLAGHAKIETTARYDRRGEATKRRAAARIAEL